ncbi:MAG: DUF2064 domain-containing protein [Bacteroidetes bacterium HGW-Bacteroidetes-2]|jgi:hypothetical protein|nr:MAG: DUF2064 domain-containing protein [Bacteroidetes bacterium HGW-Bacteroidetes-2]
MNPNTALLIFANTAIEECKNKHFSQAHNLFEALNKNTLKTVQKTGIPYFIFTEKEQVGTNFAQRFTNAIQAVFDKGFQNIITIGNDTPHLQSKHIVDTVEKLQNNQLVLGPSTDGGFYLMGLKKSHFNPKTFLKLPWQTAQLTKTIARLIGKKNKGVSFLETLQDIDFVADVKAILKDKLHQISLGILLVLKQVIRSLKPAHNKITSLYHSLCKSTYFNKGSPQMLHI